MTGIYDQHSTTFRAVSAYVVVKDGERVATVAFKFGTSVTAFVHWIGVEMVKGRAGGGGYDRQSAACAAAARKIPDDITGKDQTPGRAAFIDALSSHDGAGWVRLLEDAGFRVLQAV